MSSFTAEPMNTTPSEEVLQKGERWLKSGEVCWTTSAFLSLNEWYALSIPETPLPGFSSPTSKAVREYSPVQFVAAAVKHDAEKNHDMLVRGKFKIRVYGENDGDAATWKEQWFDVGSIVKIVKTTPPDQR